MRTTWRTLWQQTDIVVYRNEMAVDRLAAGDIERVYLIYRGHGDSPGDIAQSVVQLAGTEGYALFESHTGFAGRVNFERQALWREKACVYWVSAASAALPWRLRFGVFAGEASAHAFRRLAHEELAASVARWRLEGPEVWDERKQRRVEKSRPFGYGHKAQA